MLCPICKVVDTEEGTPWCEKCIEDMAAVARDVEIPQPSKALTVYRREADFDEEEFIGMDMCPWWGIG